MRIIYLSVLCLFLANTAIAQNKKFEFIAFGDMPYRIPNDYPRFENLIKQINSEKPAFSVHVGDFKSGSTPCSDEYFKRIYNYFGTFTNPLIYTPGDNEWTDCNRKAAGEYNPLERLAFLRKMFFSTNESFGHKKLDLNSQAENAQFSSYVENVAWEYGGIQFATIHLVGTNNNLKENGDNSEFIEREKANLAWLEDIYTKAADKKGLVMFTQADMFYMGTGSSGFEKIRLKLAELSKKYAKPVLLVNGDSHRFIVDKPLLNEDKRSTILNFTRLQVFGDADMASVKVIINPKLKELFTFQELFLN
jgi:hypothetical protein